MAIAVLLAPMLTVSAGQDAAALREEGLDALRSSERNPDAIVLAAGKFLDAALLYERNNETEMAVEANSFLYWCRKKMTSRQIADFLRSRDTAAERKMEDVAREMPVENARAMYDRAEKFAAEKPGEHFAIAVRYFEVADRFLGTEVSLQAQKKSLEAQERALVGRLAGDGTSPGKGTATRPAAPVSRDWQAKPSWADNTPMKGRAPIPDAAGLREAEKTIRDLFKADYAQTKPAEKQAFAARLLKQGIETASDPAAKYVLLREAASQAASAGDAATAMKAVTEIAKVYQVNAPAMRMEMLAKAGSAATTRETTKSLALAYLAVLIEAIAADDYETATKIAGPAESAALGSKDATLVARLQARRKDAMELQSEFTKARPALDTLSAKPYDPAASLVVGKFLCCTKGDWGAGLPLLAKSNDAALRTVAEQDLAQPVSPGDVMGLADAWWSQSEKSLPAERLRFQGRAVLYYARVFSQLAGLSKATTEKRVVTYLGAIPRTPGTPIDKHLEGLLYLLPKVYLFDLKERDPKQGGMRGKVTVAGKEAAKGLWTHPPPNGKTQVAFDLPEQCWFFQGGVAINDSSAGCETPLLFKVLGDDEVLWTSFPTQGKNSVETFSVCVAKLKRVTLLVECAGGNRNAHAVWVDPALYK